MNKWEKITLLGEKGCVYVMYLKVNLKIISKCCQSDLSKYEVRSFDYQVIMFKVEKMMFESI